jgi:hypothetical protein
MTNPDVYEILKKRFADLRKELTELKRKLKTEEDFTASYIRRLHESEKKREEWQAIAENTMDASSEGAWTARALDAERGLAGLREFVVQSGGADPGSAVYKFELSECEIIGPNG